MARESPRRTEVMELGAAADGPKAVRRLRRVVPDARVLVLTDRQDDAATRATLSRGCDGYRPGRTLRRRH